jgi:hypothetical protein
MRVSLWLFILVIIMLVVLLVLFSVNIYHTAQLLNLPKPLQINPVPYMVMNIIGLLVVLIFLIFWLTYCLTGTTTNNVVVQEKIGIAAL